MYNNYSPKKANSYWHSRRRLDNRLKVVVDKSTLSIASKYRYKKNSTPVVIVPPVSSSKLLSVAKSVTSTKFSDSSIKMTVGVKSSKIGHPNVYINPHFKPSQYVPLHQDVRVASLVTTVSKSKLPKQAGIPVVCSVSKPIPDSSTSHIPMTSVHVNPSVFSSDTVLYSSPAKLNSLAPKLPLVHIGNGTNTSVENRPNLLDLKRKIHVNPIVLSSRDNLPISASNALKSVHVNPKVFARLKSEVKKENPRLATPVLVSSKLTQSEIFSKRALVAISRTKLVRSRKLSVGKVVPNQHFVTPKTRLLSVGKYTPSPSTKIVRSLRSKYKYVRKSSATPTRFVRPHQRLGISPFVRTKYKLDRRQQKMPSLLKKVHKYSVKYEISKQEGLESNLQGIMQYKRLSSSSKSPFGNRVLGNMRSLQPKRVVITDRKLLRIGSTPVIKKSRTCVQRSTIGSTLVRIGGILYKTSRTQLTRTHGLTPKSETKFVRKTSLGKKSKFVTGHVVNVRGNKFLMDVSGKTLRRCSGSLPAGQECLKRVDIGGATFVQTTPNVLIRTNTQNIRSMISQVKQKSIAVLSKQLRKNNTICRFYRRFGRCYRNEKGRCPCIHDKKYVAICKSFLLGKCNKDGCALSHELIPEKMPTCKYFLQACCVRDDCPYTHVKLNAQAPLCLGYLQGYCDDGLNCRKWHFNICPQFDKNGKCTKGKYCPFPHKPRKHMELSVDHLIVNVEKIMKMYQDHLKAKIERKSEPEKIFRYFNFDKQHKLSENDGNGLGASTDSLIDSASLSSPTSSEDNGSDFMIKRKIGFLPSYIPLKG